MTTETLRTKQSVQANSKDANTNGNVTNEAITKDANDDENFSYKNKDLDEFLLELVVKVTFISRVKKQEKFNN